MFEWNNDDAARRWCRKTYQFSQFQCTCSLTDSVKITVSIWTTDPLLGHDDACLLYYNYTVSLCFGCNVWNWDACCIWNLSIIFSESLATCSFCGRCYGSFYSLLQPLIRWQQATRCWRTNRVFARVAFNNLYYELPLYILSLWCVTSRQ